jgi:hypothetical protein
LKIFSSLAPYREQISGFASIFQKFFLFHLISVQQMRFL